MTLTKHPSINLSWLPLNSPCVFYFSHRPLLTPTKQRQNAPYSTVKELGSYWGGKGFNPHLPTLYIPSHLGWLPFRVYRLSSHFGGLPSLVYQALLKKKKKKRVPAIEAGVPKKKKKEPFALAFGPPNAYQWAMATPEFCENLLPFSVCPPSLSFSFTRWILSPIISRHDHLQKTICICYLKGKLFALVCARMHKWWVKIVCRWRVLLIKIFHIQKICETITHPPIKMVSIHVMFTTTPSSFFIFCAYVPQFFFMYGHT